MFFQRSKMFFEQNGRTDNLEMFLEQSDNRENV